MTLLTYFIGLFIFAFSCIGFVTIIFILSSLKKKYETKGDKK